MKSTNPIQPFFKDVISDLQDPEVLTQLAVLCAALLLSFAIARVFLQWTERHVAHNATSGALRRRLSFPLVCAGVLSAVKWATEGVMNVHLMHLVVTLMLALALVRVLVYVLKRSFRDSALIQQFSRGIELLVWGGVAIYISGIWPDIESLLDAYYLPVGKTKISLLSILQASLSVGLTMMVALWLGAALETRLMGASRLDMSLRVVLTRFLRALVLVAALLFSLSLAGIDLTVLSVFGGALGVGLGLGMQKIASNYVSGFIILLDRSVRIGDLISVGGFVGRVSTIKTRYTVVRAIDGTESIIPNENLIGSPVINQTLIDKRKKIVIACSVEPQSPLESLLEAFRHLALEHEKVVNDPAPRAVVTDLMGRGVTLELTCWTLEPDEVVPVLKSNLTLQMIREVERSGTRLVHTAAVSVP